MKKVEITEENLQKAHEKGRPDVKKALENMFPEVFESKYFDLTKLESDGILADGMIFTEKSAKEAGFKEDWFFKIRNTGEYEGKAFWVSEHCNWEIKRDDCDLQCLIPTKK